MPLDDTGYERHIGDLDKIDRVIDLLSSERKWCKQRLRTGDGRRCILGAMMDANATSLKKPILRAISAVTNKHYSRIEAFNDAPTTTHDLVLRVLHQTREDIIRMAAEPSHLRLRALQEMEASVPSTRWWRWLKYVHRN